MTNQTDRAYYRNSLRAWRLEFIEKRRSTVARHATMVRARHPDANDQGILVRHLDQFIAMVETAERVADALAPADHSGGPK